MLPGDPEGQSLEDSGHQVPQQSVACSYPVTYKTGHLVGIDQPIRLIIPAYIMPSECTYNALVDLSLQDKLDQRGFETSGFDAFGSMIQGEEASEALSESGGLFPYMPFLQPIRYQETEGDDLSKLGYLGSFIKDNPDRSFQVGLYFQFWKRNASATHAWIIFHRDARAEDPKKSFQDIHSAVDPKKVEGFKNLFPSLEGLRNQNEAYFFYVMQHDANYQALKKHPLGLYFSDFIDSFKWLNNNQKSSLLKEIWKEHEGDVKILCKKARKKQQIGAACDEDGELDLDHSAAWKLYDRILSYQNIPWVLEEYAFAVHKFTEDQHALKGSADHEFVEKGFKLAHLAAALGSDKAQALMASKYRSNFVPPCEQKTKEDNFLSEAIYHLRSAFQGNVGSKYELARMYLNGEIGKSKEGNVNYEESGRLFLELASEGPIHSQCIYAQYIYAQLLEKKYISVDESALSALQQSVKWYKRASKAGHVEASYALGSYYEDGKIGLSECGSPDLEEALFYYWKATYGKHVEAFEHFFDIFRLHPEVKISLELNRGINFPNMFDRQSIWLHESTHRSEISKNAWRSLFLLARENKTTNGRFLNASYKEAIVDRDSKNYLEAFSGFLPHAIYLENPKAMHNIGMILYKKGDLISAKQWFEAASDHGLEASKRNLERIASELKTKTPPFVMRVYFKKEGGELSFNNAGFHINTGDKLEAYKDKSDFEILQGIALSRDPGVKFDYDLLSHGALMYFY